MLARDVQLMLASGVILLVISLVNGFFIHGMPLPRLALSAHLVGLMGSTFLFALGACWPALGLGRRASRVGSLAAVFGFFGGWIVYFVAAATGTGGMFPLASLDTRGTPLREATISTALLAVALALFVICGIALTGLTGRDGRKE